MFRFKSDERRLSKNIEPKHILINPLSTDPRDPEALHGDNAILVSMLLQQYACDKTNPFNTMVFHTNQTYRIYYRDVENPKKMRECVIRLTHDVVCREEQSLKTGQIKFRGSVISNNPNDVLGSGNFGSVIRLAGTLALENDGSVQLKTNKNRVIKIQNTNKPNAPVDSEEIARNEAMLLPFLPHSHGKSMTFEYDSNHQVTRTYLVMEEFKGIELFDVLLDDMTNNAVLSLSQRIKISINLLEALDRMHARGIVHRDIKPENILINLATCEVRIIDAGLGRMNNRDDGKNPGTLFYSAPEGISRKYPQTQESDTYSMALVMFLLWRGRPRPDDFDKDFAKISAVGGGYELAIFPTLDQIPGLNRTQKQYIREVLTGMTRIEPNTRMSPQNALAYFQHIHLEHQFDRNFFLLSEPDKKEINAACAFATYVRFHLLRSTISISNDNITDKLRAIKQIITSAVTDPTLSDGKPALGKFVEVLGVKAFQGVNNKAEIAQRTKQITDEFHRHQIHLKMIRERVAFNLSLLNSVAPSIPNHRIILAHINELDSYTNSVLNKYCKTKRVCDLDDLVELNMRYQTELPIIEDAMRRIIERECPEIISSCADLLQRLKTTSESIQGSALDKEKSKVIAVIDEYIHSLVSTASFQIETSHQLLIRCAEANELVTLLEDAQDNTSLETGLAQQFSKSKSSGLLHCSIFASPVYGSRLTALLHTSSDITQKNIGKLQHH